MKKLAPSLVALSVCVSAIHPAFAETDGHFRMARWYDGIEQVKNKEHAPFVEQRKELVDLAGGRSPMPVESLYFSDSLMGKPVLVRYRFDADCGQLFQGSYIFEKVFGDRDVFSLVDEFERRYGTNIYIQYPNGILYAVGRVGKETRIRVTKAEATKTGSKRTVVNALTIHFTPYGWRKGKAPRCSDNSSTARF